MFHLSTYVLSCLAALLKEVTVYWPKMPGYKQELQNFLGTKSHGTCSPPSTSSLFRQLLHLWSIGELSASACQSIAYAAHLDGITHEAVVKLAATGSWGKHTNNISRDLKTFITKESKGTFAMPAAVNIPCWNPRTSRNENADFSYFDPASVVKAFYDHTELFEYFFQPKLVASFWQNIRQDDPRRLLLFQETGLQQNDLPHIIDLWLHGDGVEFVDGHSLMTLSFGSVLNVGPSLDSSLLLFAFPKDCADAKTWEHVWAHIVPSFLQMQQGLSAEGTPLAGKWRFVIWQIMGDHEWYSNFVLLPHWAKPKSCWECHLTGPQQMERLAEPIDKGSCRTLGEETNCRLSEHSIFTIPGVSHFNICQDAMHILYCGGVFSHAMGNALKYWCYHSNCMGKRSLKEKVSLIWGKMQSNYKSLGIENRLSCLKATMFVNTERPHQEKPFFKIKAGECKSLVHVFAQLAIDFHTGDETSAAILAVCESMAQFTDLLSSCSRHCTDLECEQAEEILLAFMVNYKFLQLHRPTDFMWHTVPKFHTSKHLAASFKLGSPKFSWCFRNEDFCGRMATMGHSCSFGTKSLALSTKITEKYRLLMFIRQWQNRE